MTDLDITEIQFVDDSPTTAADGKPERPTTGTCGVCGAEFEISPKGRVPANCPEHRKNAKAGSTGTASGTPRKGRGFFSLFGKKRPKRGRRRTAKLSADKYADMAFETLTSYVVGPMIVAGAGLKHPGLGATGFTLGYQTAPRQDPETGQTSHGPIPEALGEIAVLEPDLADLLERLNDAGPWVKLTMAIAPIVPQLIANVGIFGSGWLKTAHPELLRSAAVQQLQEMAANTVVPFADMVMTEEEARERAMAANGNGSGHPY